MTSAEVVIASSGTESTEVTIYNHKLVGISMPAAFTGTAITIDQYDGTTWRKVVDGAGANVSYTVAAGKYIAIDPAKLQGVDRFRLVSGSSEGAERTLTIHAVPI